MRRLIVPAFLCSNLLIAKSVPLKALILLDGKSEIIKLENVRHARHKTEENIAVAYDSKLWTSGSALLREAKHHLGKHYVWGAVGPGNFDCSGFVCYVCKKNGVTLPRTSTMQARVGKKVERRELRPGDLIFFDTSKEKKGAINHVGIYLGNNKFIHASSAKKKVMISSLNKHFYRDRFKWGRRLDR